MKLEQVDPKRLKPNPWNTNIVSPEDQAKLEESIARLDLFKPIIVRTLADGSLQILGGEHRAEAAASKGLQEVPIINLGVIDDIKAKEISVVDNSRYGIDDSLKLAELLDELGGSDVLSSFTPFSTDELDAIFSAKSIDFDELGFDEDDEDLPALPETTSSKATQTHQIMRFKVSLEDSEMVTELMTYIMKAQKFDGEDALTNAGDALVHMAGKYRSLLTDDD